MKLWLVSIDVQDWDWDRFNSCVVWAETAEKAIKSARRTKRLMIDPGWKLNADPVRRRGVIHDSRTPA